jgi:hypothetical protein
LWRIDDNAKLAGWLPYLQRSKLPGMLEESA